MATILTKSLPTPIFILLKSVDYKNISGAKLEELRSKLLQFDSHFPKTNVFDKAIKYNSLDFPEWLQNFVNRVDWSSISKLQLTLMETFLKNEVVALPKLK